MRAGECRRMHADNFHGEIGNGSGFRARLGVLLSMIGMMNTLSLTLAMTALNEEV